MDNKLKHDLATLSDISYFAPNIRSSVLGEIPSNYTLVGERTSIPLGFNGASFYNSSTNTLAIGIAGTNQWNPMDLIQDGYVSSYGYTGQYFAAASLRDESLATLAKQGVTSPTLIYTGHSLGGVPAQMLALQDSNAQGVVFNSPGLGGIWGDLYEVFNSDKSNLTKASNVTYVYSQEWGFASPIHALGMRIPGSTIDFVEGTSGHKIGPLAEGLKARIQENNPFSGSNRNSVDAYYSDLVDKTLPSSNNSTSKKSSDNIFPYRNKEAAEAALGNSTPKTSIDNIFPYRNREAADEAAERARKEAEKDTSWDEESNEHGNSSSTGKPVVIDMDGDGIELTKLNESTTDFDFDDDGYLERTAWTTGDDALLVFDIGNDGKVIESKEIAFAKWTEEDDTDLEALATHFDTNKDKVLDSRDAGWSSFKIWQDRDTDGVVDDGEMLTLEEAGIKSIGLRS
ncbi:hypothetical protein [Marinomonas shanghaiensis]|uniref:hypothetical protein n=1 Tax=Marinomonas shanghaiensis TaxID=2202418 RepID=UPI000DB9E49F|nr:hypothetical protein [Marinomonas shanghaiensis]